MAMIAEENAERAESSRWNELSKSFVSVLAAYQLIQVGIFIAYSLPMGFFHRYFAGFLASSIGFHGFVLWLLFLFRGDFVIEPGGVKLRRVNKANMITLFRLSTLPTILFVILASKDYPMRYQLIALVAIVFATDFLDGYVSRRDKEATRVGKMMDSASDYSLLFVISLVFHYFHIIPGWFLALLVARLAGQAAMLLVVLAVKKRVTPRTSFLGKATVASTMILYAFELLRYVADIPPLAFRILEYSAGAIVAASIVDKAVIMARDLKAQPKAPASAAGELGRLNSTNGERDGNDQERARDSDGADQGPEGRP